MGYKTKIQRIDRPKSQQWYITLPSALAQALSFKKGETVEWEIDSKGALKLLRGSRRR